MCYSFVIHIFAIPRVLPYFRHMSRATWRCRRRVLPTRTGREPERKGTTMNITINLDTFTFRRAGHVIEVNPANLNASIIAQLVMHGVTQKVGDAAAGKHGADAADAMQATLATLEAGNWGRARKAGDAEAVIMRFIRKVIAANLSPENVALLKECDSADEREEFLNGLWEGIESDETREKIESRAQSILDGHRAEQERRKRERAANTMQFSI